MKKMGRFERQIVRVWRSTLIEREILDKTFNIIQFLVSENRIMGRRLVLESKDYYMHNNYN